MFTERIALVKSDIANFCPSVTSLIYTFINLTYNPWL